MILTIDTKEKTIQLEEPVNLQELIEQMKSIFKDDWKKYTIQNKPDLSDIIYHPYTTTNTTFEHNITCTNEN